MCSVQESSVRQLLGLFPFHSIPFHSIPFKVTVLFHDMTFHGTLTLGLNLLDLGLERAFRLGHRRLARRKRHMEV